MHTSDMRIIIYAGEILRKNILINTISTLYYCKQLF